jgi:hypothetical protein
MVTRWWALAVCTLCLLVATLLPVAQATFWAEYECPSVGDRPCTPIRDAERVLARAKRAHTIRSANARTAKLHLRRTAEGETRDAVPRFVHRTDLNPDTLWRDASCVDPKFDPNNSVHGSACHWIVVILGESGGDVESAEYGWGGVAGDVDIFVEPSADLLALSAAGFPEPEVWWNPTEQAIANMPHHSPILMLSHTTDGVYEEEPYDDAFYALRGFRPIPPLSPDSSYTSTSDVFTWGYPEPFPWLDSVSRRPWVPPRTRLQTLYPFRYHPLVVLATCYSRAWSGAPTVDQAAVSAPLNPLRSLLSIQPPASKGVAVKQWPVLDPPNPLLVVGIADAQYEVDTSNAAQGVKPYPPLLRVLRAYSALLLQPDSEGVAQAIGLFDMAQSAKEEAEDPAIAHTTYSVEEFNFDLASEVEYLRAQAAVYWDKGMVIIWSLCVLCVPCAHLVYQRLEWAVLQRLGLGASSGPLQILDVRHSVLFCRSAPVLISFAAPLSGCSLVVARAGSPHVFCKPCHRPQSPVSM